MAAELPVWLPLDGLRRRLDLETGKDDVLLDELLRGALRQAQEPPPFGTGRVLVPDPSTSDGRPDDSAAPVSRQLEVRGRRVLVPDARELTRVQVTDPWTGEPAEDVTGYGLSYNQGLIVAIRLARSHVEQWWHGGLGWGGGEFGYTLAPREHERQIVVTGRFGFAEVPQNVVNAIYTLAARRYFERQAEYADAVVIHEGAASQTYSKLLPAEVKAAFDPLGIPAGQGGLA